ncbi:MAG: hypothetical protein Fur0010_17770 [Bdellovibrio sp.]
MQKCLWLLLGLLFLGSCHQKNDEPIVVTSPEIQRSSETLKVIFPHSSEFKKSRQHGAFYLKDQKLCQSCHVPTEVNGNLKQEFCLNCHKNYPHDQQFKDNFDHGVAYLKDKRNCQSCHGVENSLTHQVAQKCITCHQYPHESGFVAKEHSQAYFNGKNNSDLRVNCQHCHQKDGEFHRRNENSFVSCTSCHFNVPHDYGSFMRHPRAGKNYREVQKKQCIQCHNPLDKYHKEGSGYPSDPAPTACISCHEGLGHNKNLPKGHPNVHRALSSPELPVWESEGRILERK